MTPQENLGPIPPDDMIRTYLGHPSAEQYISLGDGLKSFMIEYGGLQPDHKVLDVGCSIGLAARPLTTYLSGPGSYDGFDVVPESIEWCRRNYRGDPRFTFQLADVYNKHYNPTGRFAGREYVFPYPAETFDMIVLASVFTHLLPDDLTNYLTEIARVMKRGGRCVISYFLLNPESLGQIESWLNDHPGEAGVPGGLGFRWPFDDRCRLYSKEVPEQAVACSESWIRGLYDEHGLAIDMVLYGEWCRRSLQPGWQDLIMARKAS
jgi:SAM-dependent methyltransferase